ncbi:MAG TPA: large conductance mechanosensitive channel protein MscL [Dongiaceae bacterium]|nr:large conductance mechanosensitive channel protein MscL [Dongiaceae bacterium]
MLKEFKEFLTKSNALALAIGVIIGGAVGKVVTSLVENILMPLIGLVLPGGEWREIRIPLRTDAAGKVVSSLGVGPLLGSIVDFLIISAVIFMITKALLKPPPPAPSKTCPYCKETCPPDATKCRACASAI